MRPIADAAQRMNRDACPTLGQTFAKSRYVDLDGIRRYFLIETVNLIFQHVLGHNPAAAAHQLFQHRHLAARNRNRLVVDANFPRRGIEIHVARVKHQSERPTRPAQQCPNPRHQLIHVKRLQKIVIATGVKPAHTILDRVPRRQNQHGGLIAMIPPPLENIQAVLIRQPEIENNRIITDGRDRRIG